jgi:hypothetical protein
MRNRHASRRDWLRKAEPVTALVDVSSDLNGLLEQALVRARGSDVDFSGCLEEVRRRLSARRRKHDEAMAGEIDAYRRAAGKGECHLLPGLVFFQLAAVRLFNILELVDDVVVAQL